MNPTWDQDPQHTVTSALPVSATERPNPLRRRRWVPATALVGGVLGAGIFLASTANATVALSDDGGSASSTSSTAPSAPDAGTAPAADGTAPTPPAGGPAAAGAAPTPAVDGSAPTPPAGGPAADGSAPTPPADGTAPTPPADGTAPTPPAGGPGAGRGPGGPAAGPVADGSTAVVGTVAASSDTGITVQSDSGDSVSAVFTADTTFGAEPKAPGAEAGTTPRATTAADFALGSRVEIRVLDGNIVSARLVTAHADGTLTALSGSSGTVTTREGLKIPLDLSGVTTTAAVGDDVHVRGTVDAAGTTIVVTSIDVPAAK